MSGEAIGLSPKVSRSGFFGGGSSAYLIYLLGPVCVALTYAIGVGLSLAGFVVELDLIVFVFLAVALLGIVVLGRTAEIEERLARILTPGGMLVVLICLFLIPILESFRLRLTNGYFMFGFVPWSDAEAYIPGGWQMLVDGPLSEWHQRRPINASVMELRLLLAGFNLHALVLLNSLMLALATLFAALEIEKHIGVLATAFFVVVLFGYAQPYLPSTLSEMLGLCLGIVAFAALMRSARLGLMWQFVIGLALLSFALNARAGNYFVLPAVWLWGVIYLGRNWRQRAVVGAMGGIALLSGFVYSLLLIKLFGSGEVMTYNANFGDVLYGLARGGVGWHRAQEDHPELYTGVDAAQRAMALFKISLQEIASHPLRFVGVYFNDMGGAICSIFGGPKLHLIDGLQVATILADVFTVIHVVGIAGLLIFAFDRRNALIVLALLGFVTSVPFIWHDGGPRVLAASMPFVLFVAPVGLRIAGLFFQGNDRRVIWDCLAPLRTPPSVSDFRFSLVPGSTLLVVAVIPFILAGSMKRLGAPLPDKPISAVGPRCPADTSYLKFDHNRLMYAVRVHAGNGQILDSMTDITFGQLQDGLAPFHISKLFRDLPAPYTIFAVMSGDASRRNFLTIVWQGELKQLDTKDVWHGCIGELSHDLTGYLGHVYFVAREL